MSQAVALTIRDLEFAFPSSGPVLSQLSLDCEEGKIYALIGANGSGKTTLFNVVTGYAPASAGQVRLYGTSLLGIPPHSIARLGVARTFQTTQLLPGKTLAEHFHLAQSHTLDTRTAHGNTGTRPAQHSHFRRVHEELELTHLLHRKVHELSYGQQRVSALACSLLQLPRVLMLDEPVAGLDRNAQLLVGLQLQRAKQVGQTVLLIEHDFSFIRRIEAEILLLKSGAVTHYPSIEDIDATLLTTA